MAFWGVYLKPNEPYTLHYDDAVPKRLRITQATLGNATRNSPARSIVRCSVGDKPALAICSLSVRELTCCQLELEFEESDDVIFSVMGPRGVYLAGYLINPVPIADYHPIDCKAKKTVTAEISGANDHDLHQEQLDFNKRVKESTDGDDKSLKGEKHLLKCVFDKNKQEKIIVTLDRQMGDGIEKKKKRKRKKNKKRKLSTPEATANDLSDEEYDLDTEEKGSSPKRSHNKDMEKKSRRKHTLDDDKHYNTGQINGVPRMANIENSRNFEKQRLAPVHVEDDCCRKERKISKIVFTKKIFG